MEEKEVQGAPVHKRRVRYSGTHPKRFEEKYKEQNPEKYADTVEKEVMADILNDFEQASRLGIQVQHGSIQPRRLSVHHHDDGHRHGPLRKAGLHHHAERAPQGAG